MVMDEETLRQEMRPLREEVHSLREEVSSLHEEGHSAIREEGRAVREELHGEIRASAERLAAERESQTRQLVELHQLLVEKIERCYGQFEEQLDATLQEIEHLHSPLERRQSRLTDLGRRITALETRPQQ